MGASKVLVWSIVLGIAFAIGMVLLVNKVTQTSRDRALAETNAEVARMESPRGPSMLDAAAAVASPFVAHIAAGRHADAYALLAAPYRDAVSLPAFAKTCAASPILAGARSVTLNSLRQQSAGTARTIEASGVLDSRAGAVPIGFVFTGEGGKLRILVVSLAGVPVLQGVAPR
ncbi:MAG TPA: hypothetical protein VKQ32_07260 [Polyangia bacterium]|nr:hypothetical protein [Polyangia bacterium]